MKTIKHLLLGLLTIFCLGLSTPSFAQTFCNGKSCTPEGAVYDIASLQSQINAAPIFITGFTPNSPGTLDNLYANAPCNATRSNYYAAVVDLYGVLTEALRCTNFGPWGYGWRATIPFYAATVTTNGGTIVVSCNKTAPVLRVTNPGVSSLTSNLTVTFSNIGCTPGQRQELQMDLSLGIYTATANGLVGTTLSKLLGATSSSLYVFDTVGWRAY